MKHPFKRGLSWLLALVLIVSLVSGLTVPARAEGYTYNWGYRGTTATELSDSAYSFYTDNDTSCERLSVYAGASEVADVPSSDLYGALQALMTDNHTHITEYAQTRDLFQYTDCQGGGGKVSSFYVGAEIGPAWDGTWNREHTWPNSKGLEGSDEDDLMMLRPTTTTENSGRGNKAYGLSAGYFDPNKDSGGQYNLRGDVARIMLYVYVRWGNTGKMWGTDGVMESKDVLLDWMEEDPVDTWELGRNDAVQSITGTRNVFVDYPELAFRLFDETVPADMVTPSGSAGHNFSLVALSNDEQMGTISYSGKNIIAHPKEGYKVAGYTILGGEATVVQYGNSFVVNATTSDCTLRIHFAPKEQVTVTYMEDGQVCGTETVTEGEQVILSDPEREIAGYTFQGWTEEQVNHTQSRPILCQPGEKYTVSENTTLYAVYSYLDATDVSQGWYLVTDASQLAPGQQVVLASAKGFVAGGVNNTYLTSVAAEFSDDLQTISTLPDSAVVLTLGGDTGAWTFANSSGTLLGATAVKKVAFGKGTTTWTIEITDDNATIQNTTASYGRFLYNVSSPRFTTYTSNTNSNMLLPQLYVMKNGDGATVYTTATCVHQDTQVIEAKDANCTEDGITAGIWCNDCGAAVTGCEKLPAIGHDYKEVVTEPTVTTDGYISCICQNCGHSYINGYIPALGETYTVSFSVPEGVPAIADKSSNSAGIMLPEAQAPDGNEGLDFLGWTTAPVDNTTHEPVYYAAGDHYVAQENMTFYALYTYAQGGTGESAYVLVEDESQLIAGKRIVIASADQELAMSTTQNGNNRGQAEIAKSGNTISLGEGVAELTLGAGTIGDTWSFYCDDNAGYLYAASSSANYLRTKADLDDNGSFAIELGENGAATVTAQGDKTRNLLRYNGTNQIFSCYGSGQGAVSFYIETVDGTVYYTTQLTAASAPMPGDTNADGSVDNRDVIHLFRYITGLGVEVHQSVRDVNGDGSVDNRDVIYLFRYITGIGPAPVVAAP